tara:strand:+ start:3257 stop:4072 length:816 start_codon:yes stop_codon:yes gene_type:complete
LRSAVLLLFVFFSVSPVLASGPDLAAARAAFDAGNFARAAELARDLKTAKGDALASRAESVRGEFAAEGDDRLKRYEAALADGRRALARNPRSAEAHLAIAISLGLAARNEGRMAAHFAGIGREARLHIDKALELAPENAWAWAARGGWNIEIAYDGGVIGRMVYGASIAAGVDAYERALVLAPRNMSIAWQYAFQLAGLGGENLPRANALLADIAGREPATALEELLRASALELKDALDRGDKAALARILAFRLGRGDAPPPASGFRGKR